ncbi:MAG: hypothetical protein J7L90_01045 [Dehalococcoidia bacterium]|nr:hypothetical protein [Dehalococcoidia bacterium]
MFELVSALALIGFIAWIIYRAVTAQKSGKLIQKVLNLHVVMYGLSSLAGVCSLAYFLSMNDVSKFIKVVACVGLGIALIVIASLNQRKNRDMG